MEDKLKFSPLHLRRQMVAHFIQNKDLLYDIVKEGLIENYGLPPDPNGEGIHKRKSKLVLLVLLVT